LNGLNCRQSHLPTTVGESNDFTDTAQLTICICDIDTAFHVHEAFYSVWTLKGKGSFFMKVKFRVSLKLKLDRCGNWWWKKYVWVWDLCSRMNPWGSCVYPWQSGGVSVWFFVSCAMLQILSFKMK
jgi:hypothetical protein